MFVSRLMKTLVKSLKRNHEMLKVKGAVGAICATNTGLFFRIKPISACSIERDSKRYAVAYAEAEESNRNDKSNGTGTDCADETRLVDAKLIPESEKISLENNGKNRLCELLICAKEMNSICEFAVNYTKRGGLSLRSLTIE